MRQHTVQAPYLVDEAHFYSTEIDGNLVLFDTGPPTPDALARLRAEVDISRLRYVFITHCHVDHYGLAALLAQQGGAEILIPFKDAVKFRRHAERLARVEGLLDGCGFDAPFIRGFRSIVENAEIFPRPPERYRIVEESDIPERLGITLLSCPGHSQSDLVYWHRDWAVTGDVLLRNIFQAPLLDVDLETFSGRFRNYDAYCASLLELAKLSGCTVLPGHRDYVESVDDTIVSYVRKMLERAGEVKRFAAVESIRDVVDRLFEVPPANPFFIYLKASEIVFMRDFLADPRRLGESLETIGLFDRVEELYGAVAD
jgi:2,4-dienoyl-CoA reductase (NADPH2)